MKPLNLWIQGRKDLDHTHGCQPILRPRPDGKGTWDGDVLNLKIGLACDLFVNHCDDVMIHVIVILHQPVRIFV